MHPRLRPLLAILLACSASAGPHGPAGWARGDLHQHTRYSTDASWELEALWARLRETLPVGMRFTVLTDHNDIAGFFPDPTRPPRADNWRSWGHVRELRRGLGDGELLLAGQELGGLRAGHMGALLLPQLAGQDPPALVVEKGFRHAAWMQRIRAAGGLNAVFHPRGVAELGPVHPGTFTRWEECAELIDLVSVWNGYKLYDEPDAVAWEWLFAHWQAGRRYTAVGGSDAHKQVKDGEQVPYWGKEFRIGFESHPMNPHNRVAVGEHLDEDSLRGGLRRGRVTVADWHQNWVDMEVQVGRGPGAVRGGIGETLVAGVGAPLVVRVRGFGAPDVYSGDPRLVLDYGVVGAPVVGVQRVEAEGEGVLEVPLRGRQSVTVPLPRGDFEVEVPLTLGAGEWVVAGRVLPDSPLADYWRGVQVINPVRVRVGGR